MESRGIVPMGVDTDIMVQGSRIRMVDVWGRVPKPERLETPTSNWLIPVHTSIERMVLELRDRLFRQCRNVSVEAFGAQGLI